LSDDHTRACDRLLAELQALSDDDDLRLDGTNVPGPPAALSMDRVIARRGEHQYGMPRGAWRVDTVRSPRFTGARRGVTMPRPPRGASGRFRSAGVRSPRASDRASACAWFRTGVIGSTYNLAVSGFDNITGSFFQEGTSRMPVQRAHRPLLLSVTVAWARIKHE
jgi:hypothetical protein